MSIRCPGSGGNFNCDVALGRAAQGTYKWAESKGYKHFGGKEYAGVLWMGPVENAIRDPKVTRHVNLDDLGTFEQAARDGLQTGAKSTEIEMSWIARAVANGERSWDSIRWYRTDPKTNAKVEFDLDEPDWSSFGRLRPFLSGWKASCGC